MPTTESKKDNGQILIHHWSISSPRRAYQKLKRQADFNKSISVKALEKVKSSAINQENIFEELMEACKYCSLGEITKALFDVGGQYRRNM